MRVAALKKVALALDPSGTPILLGDVATVQLGPDIRRGLSELNGQGEVRGFVEESIVERERAAQRVGLRGQPGDRRRRR